MSSPTRGRDHRGRDLVRDGLVVLAGFLDEHEVATARAAVDSILDAPHDQACSRPHNTLVLLRRNDRIVQLVRRALRADDLRWISGYVSTKAARSPALWWHQDWWCRDHAVTYRPAAPQVAILCFLSDTVASNERIQDTLGLDLDARVVEVDEPVLVEAFVRRRRTGRRSEFGGYVNSVNSGL